MTRRHKRLSKWNREIQAKQFELSFSFRPLISRNHTLPAQGYMSVSWTERPRSVLRNTNVTSF